MFTIKKFYYNFFFFIFRIQIAYVFTYINSLLIILKKFFIFFLVLIFFNVFLMKITYCTNGQNGEVDSLINLLINNQINRLNSQSDQHRIVSTIIRMKSQFFFNIYEFLDQFYFSTHNSNINKRIFRLKLLCYEYSNHLDKSHISENVIFESLVLLENNGTIERETLKRTLFQDYSYTSEDIIVGLNCPRDANGFVNLNLFLSSNRFNILQESFPRSITSQEKNELILNELNASRFDYLNKPDILNKLYSIATSKPLIQPGQDVAEFKQVYHELRQQKFSFRSDGRLCESTGLESMSELYESPPRSNSIENGYLADSEMSNTEIYMID